MSDDLIRFVSYVNSAPQFGYRSSWRDGNPVSTSTSIVVVDREVEEGSEVLNGWNGFVRER
jgi:hypothetical protein